MLCAVLCCAMHVGWMDDEQESNFRNISNLTIHSSFIFQFLLLLLLLLSLG